MGERLIKGAREIGRVWNLFDFFLRMKGTKLKFLDYYGYDNYSINTLIVK